MQKTAKISSVVIILMIAAGVFSYISHDGESSKKLLTKQELAALERVDSLYSSDVFVKYDELFSNLPILNELDASIKQQVVPVDSLQMVKVDESWMLEVWFHEDDKESMALLNINEILTAPLATLVKDEQDELYLVN